MKHDGKTWKSDHLLLPRLSPPSSHPQTGLGQTVDGAEEKPGRGISKSLAFCLCTGQPWGSNTSQIQTQVLQQ
ncbi:hypothetical protein CRENBAI_019249 [Crenichthys baileyi]|uniref:Uncharacterized protein n=1 Tax=Crenichthys baileyi TaxID=28760 RepID=A0AAV9RXB5_9TELE